jgi:hypothetical protein
MTPLELNTMHNESGIGAIWVNKQSITSIPSFVEEMVATGWIQVECMNEDMLYFDFVGLTASKL